MSEITGQHTDWLDDEFAKLSTSEQSDLPEHVVQSTLDALATASLERAAESVDGFRRRTLARLSLAITSLVLLVALGFVWWSRPNEIGPEDPAIPLTAGESISTAFVEKDHLRDGQTFLLPLNPQAVRVHDTEWPEDMFAL